MIRRNMIKFNWKINGSVITLFFVINVFHAIISFKNLNSVNTNIDMKIYACKLYFVV
jgi:hypothetical protein